MSRRQYRMMRAIMSGKVKDGPRGRPPASVAAKFTSPGKDAPEQSGSDRGGTWGEEHHKKAKQKVTEARHTRKKNKNLKKAFEEFYQSEADKTCTAATVVMDDMGRILFGDHSEGLSLPGGYMDDADIGSHAITAMRELNEETGLTGHNPTEIWKGKIDGCNTVVFLVESFTGDLKAGDDLSNLKWIEPLEIEWDKVRPCDQKVLKTWIEQHLGKSLSGMLLLEKLEKNVIRQQGDAVLEVTHGDALKVVGNGLFRSLRNAVKDMTDESFKDFKMDTCIVNIRKHMSDIYSGRVTDGHKVIYQFTNKSLPELTVALMSVFEWYLPEDEKELELIDENALTDDLIEGGVKTLMDNYHKHSIGNIYQEMETIREQMRNGMAVDLQQVEARIMKLFDRLEDVIHTITDKHNELTKLTGNEIDELEQKLRDLQEKIDGMKSGPEIVEAFSTRPGNPDKVHDENYPYLPRPQVEISPNGKIKITFESEWQDEEKANFLHDLRARAIKRGK